MNKLQKIQYISQGLTAQEQFENIHKILDVGGKWIQLRWKNANYTQLSALAEQVKLVTERYRATLIINDNVSIAAEVDAHGVHLGLNDMDVLSARKILGLEKIIGGTANTVDDVLLRTAEHCDYIGLGPFRFTTTKEKLSPVLELKGYQELFSFFKEKNIQIPPVFAIGGIAEADISSLREAGVYGVALSGVLTHNPSIFYQINNELTCVV